MLRDGVGDAGRKTFARECFEDLRFGEIGVVEDDGKYLRMAFGEKRASDSAGTATCERNFLTERKLREAREQLSFGDALEFGQNTDGQSELYEIH